MEKNYLHSPEQYPAFAFKYWSWNWQFYSRHFEALESNISALVCRVHILHNKNSFLKVREISVFWRFSENCGTQIIVTTFIGTSEKTIYLFQIEQSRLRQSGRLNDIQASSSFTETILNNQNKEQWSWRSRNETQQSSDFFTLWYTVWQACMTWITSKHHHWLSWIPLPKDGINIEYFSKIWSVLFSYR